MNSLLTEIRTEALSQTLLDFHDPVRSQQYMEHLKSLPEEFVDMLAAMDKIPPNQWETYRKNLRGEPNLFLDGLNTHSAHLQSGDVILMNANAPLRGGQKVIYPSARSSHVALIYESLICIDAMPNPLNVSMRLASEVLAKARPDWRVMRLKTITKRKKNQINRASTYYLGQPYAIKASGVALPNHAYCSELVRKIYKRAKVTQTGIKDTKIIAPAHFDKLLDDKKYWVDITKEARPAIEFCREYEAFANSAFRLLIEGLNLNRQRFAERADLKQHIKELRDSKNISGDKAKNLLSYLDEKERRANHQFWDYGKRS
jgi:hypothetical protein